MKAYTTTLSLLLVLGITLSSCYKTGEIIPQPTCKPIEITDTMPVYGRYGVEGYINNIYYDATLSKVTTIRRRNTSNQNTVYFNFDYDNNNNVSKITQVEFVLNGTARTYWYSTFTYPAGTVGSYAASVTQQNFVLNSGGTYDAAGTQLLEFNTEYQLVRVSTNNQTSETYEYDFGGNLIKQTNFQNGQLYDQWTFNSYDNKICPFRADRALQLFFKIYSKNNPTSATNISYTLPQGVPNTYTYTAAFNYNANGYPTSINGKYFANYNCGGNGN